VEGTEHGSGKGLLAHGGVAAVARVNSPLVSLLVEGRSKQPGGAPARCTSVQRSRRPRRRHGKGTPFLTRKGLIRL